MEDLHGSPESPSADAGTHIPRSPQVGDYAVVAHHYGYDLTEPLSRVTAQRVYWPSRYRKGERQASKDAVLFSGSQAIAAQLQADLKSSRDQQTRDEVLARVRHVERKDKAVTRAMEAQAFEIARLSRELGASNASTGTPTNTSTHTGDQPL